MSTNRKNRMRWGIAAGAIALVLGGAAFYPVTTWAATQSALPAQFTPADPAADHETALAAALGITVADLQAAETKAAGAALDQAVEKGLLTQTQADQIRQRLDGNMPFGGKMGHFGGRGFENSAIDFDALLADALGISVDDLSAARDKVLATQLSQAVTDGKITQEQADLAQAQHDLQVYMQPRLEEARQQALKDAVAAGIVTQAQVDALQKQGWGPMGGMMGPGRGGMDGFAGPGRFGGDDDLGGHRGGHHGGRDGQGDDSAQPSQQSVPDFSQPAQPTPDQSQSNG